MTDEIIKEALKRIDVIAAKMGTTAEYLWPLIVKQEIVDSILTFLGITFATITFIIFSKWLIDSRKNKETHDDPDTKEVILLGFLIFSAIVLIMSLIFFIAEGFDWINPEYWAFKNIISMLR